MNRLTTKLITSAMVGGCLLAATSSPAQEHHVYLRAETLTKDLPGKADVLMWGFARDTDQDFTTTDGEPASVPGPQINVLDADTTLVIHLKNNLAAPVSIVIPNQNGYVRDPAAVVPEHTTFTDAQGRTRARSFVKETQPGQVGTYQWNNLTPGTYLYYSGSQPALQVQMGLYGAVVKKTSAGEVYLGQGAPSEQLVLFSEIDSKVHDAVAANDYGPGLGMSSTIHSVPDYFLINGESHPNVPALTGTADQPLLLRMLNASVNTRIPVVYGLDQKVIAEDGRLYPYPRIHTAPEFPALKTMDVLLTPATGEYTLYDRGLGLVNGVESPGGMLVKLVVP